MIDDPLSTVTRIPAAQGRRGDLLARLRAVHPRGLEWVCALGTESTVVGRTADAGGAGPLRHDTVSRSHFEVRWDAAGGTHVGRDLGSHNGSRVDGVPLGTIKSRAARAIHTLRSSLSDSGWGMSDELREPPPVDPK